MKTMSFMKRILGLLVFIPMISLGYPTGFSSGSGYQDFAYVGLGNPNEVLAFAEYNGSISVGTTINYTLYGEYADYVERVRLWARPYESSTATNSSGVPATYAFPFDSRRPNEDFGIIIDPSTGTKNVVAKGAQLIAETTDYTSTSMKSTINLAQGNYVIYLTADIRSEDEVTLDLGEIWDEANYTKIGGAINNVGTTSITTTNKEENGNRVLVTSRQPLYEPYDFYSKYYRIPCITTTSDGTLLAISDARKYHAHDIANDIDILVRRSTDNGKTWSAPVVVAKGEISGTPDNMNHAATVGYGDASIAAMPNGKVLLCMVKGNRIAAGSASDSTWVAYRVSNDNGITWESEKTVPAELLNYARGCIAPGNMCVPKEGVLKGKVLAAFRTLTRHDQSGDYHGNIFLIYDPDTDEWTRAYSNDSGSTRYIYNSFWGNSSSSEYSDSECDDHDGGFKLWGAWIGGTAKAGDDESVIVEVAKNTFLVSNRYQTSPYRTFTRLVLSETPNVATGYKYVATKLTSSGFSATAANGSIIKTTDANGKTFIIHAVPKSSETYNSRATRTALTIYTTEYDGSSTSIAWRERVCLSDPFGTLKENAQYSSMTLMADGTVGLLFEEYPQSVYANASNDGCTNLSANSDFIMYSVFMNVRPQDIIEEWGDVDYKDVAAPVITPESQTYHSEAGEQRRPTVTITNPNGEGKTTFSMLFNKADGTTVTLYDNVEFEGDSYTIEWSEIATKIGIGEEDAITTDQSIIVTAKCSIEGNSKTYTSTETQRNYLFKDPVRKVMIYARPVSGSGVGNPTIVAGSQTAGSGEIITVGVGDEVSITAFAATENPLISFSHFAYSTDTNTDKIGTTITTTSPGWSSTADVKLMAGDRQLVFKMQDVDVIPNNHSSAGDGFNDVLVLFVFYNSEKAGFKSQVITSGHMADGVLLNNTNCSTLSTDDNFEEGFDIINTQYQGEDTTLIYLKPYSNVRANYVDAESNVNYKMTSEAIIYPHRDDYSKLHLNVGVQPDSLTAKNLHAVIMFIQNGQYLRNDKGQYYYALLQGQLHQHDNADPIYKGASIIAPWYGLNEDGVYAGMTAQPAVVSSIATNLDNENIRGIKFYDMDTYLTEDLTVKPLHVMIFVITNLVTDINTVVNTSVSGTSAMYVHVHRIIQTTVPTTVESVEQEDELIIASVNGGAQFIGYEARVDVYNMMGTLVATFPLNGTRYVELPQGIYIANGKKFVVR